ncbi:MAG: glucosamine-6-phosphate deaminase, partial [Clostridiales bacterium]|nr:glucosamine-6-phosphate deaminase [Clostridiales bacterium]
GFNEPAEQFTYPTNAVTLTQDTIDANKRFFASEKEVPRRALSMGIGTIMSAKSILLIALGENKAPVVRGMVQGEITPRLPASILRAHPAVTVLLDKGAGSLL